MTAQEKTLSVYTQADIALEAAIENFARNGLGGETGVLAYAGGYCAVGRISSVAGHLEFAPESASSVRLTDVYEFRAFNAASELRWLAVAEKWRAGYADRGTATVLSDIESAGFDTWTARTVQYVDAIRDRRYVLWGKPDGYRDGWLRLREHRARPFAIPVVPPDDNAVRGIVGFVEYCAEQVEAYGNVTVFAERLTGFSTVQALTEDG